MILLITPFFPPNIGGVEIHLADYVNYLRKKRIKTVVLTYQPITSPKKGPFKEKLGSVEVIRFPYPGYNLFYKLDKNPPVQFFYLFAGLFIYTFFFLLLNRQKVKVLHSHGLAAGMISGILGKIFRKKTVLSLHTIYKLAEGSKISGMAKRIFTLNDKILAIAEGCKRDLVKIGIPAEKIVVYSYWADTSHFKPQNQSVARSKLGILGEKFIALFISRFNPEKQINEALEAARLTPEADFLFVGQGPLGDKVAQYAQKYPQIKLVGRVENQLIPLYHNAADILLLGSVDEDYFGKVTMEAMCSGLPPLITNQSYYFGKLKPIDPKVLPKDCGFMVGLDEKEISRKIKELMRQKPLLKKMRIACRAFAVTRFGPRNAQIILETCLGF